MRRLGVIAIAGMALVSSVAWGGGTKAPGRCEGKPSWKLLQTLTLTEPNGNLTFDPDPVELYKVVFSGYIKDPNGTPLTTLDAPSTPFRVNGTPVPRYTAAQWHRNHPLKDPSAVAFLIQDEPDGKSLSWDEIPTDVVPLPYPGPVPANEPCTLVSGSPLPGRELTIAAGDGSSLAPYTGTLSVAIYKLVWGNEALPSEPQVLANITFDGGNSLGRPTIRAGERRVWVNVSGSAQLSTDAEGQLQAVGGGWYSGVYVTQGADPSAKPAADVRSFRFRVDSAAGPPTGGEVTLDATVTASSQSVCPKDGATFELLLHDGGAPGTPGSKGDTIAAKGGGCLGDAFSNKLSYLSNAFVTIKTVGG